MIKFKETQELIALLTALDYNSQDGSCYMPMQPEVYKKIRNLLLKELKRK
jgi:hypothetical protein